MPHHEAAPTPSLTLLLPRLSSWIPQLSSATRYPALERILSRGRASAPLARDIDSLRMQLFGIPSQDEIPVAALELLAKGNIQSNDGSYHLRIDPVTLQADMTRVMMVKTGFGDFTAEYRQEVDKALREVLEDSGMTLNPALNPTEHLAKNPADEQPLEIGGAGHWTVTLPEHPGVTFTSLDEALGADISEHLPAGDAGRLWRRLANEIQMALHSLPSNERLRARGAPAVNGCWFWGGGRLPAVEGSTGFDCVYSLDPVSSGLARLQQSEPLPFKEWLTRRDGSPDHSSTEAGLPSARWAPLTKERTLVDWAVPVSTANEGLMVTPDRLEAVCEEALAGIKKYRGQLVLQTPEFQLSLNSSDLRAFWRRPKPLAGQLTGLLQSLGSSQ